MGFSQIPAGYYEGTSALGGYALKTKLHEIISVKNINWFSKCRRAGLEQRAHGASKYIQQQLPDVFRSVFCDTHRCKD